MVSKNPDFDAASLYVSDIYVKYSDFIYHIIRSRIGDENRADDIFQNFFLDLHAHPLPPDIRYIESYLYGAVIKNIANDILSNKRYRTHLYEYARHASLNETISSPEVAIIETEESLKLFEIIRRQLTDKEHQAITLHYADRLKIPDISTIMAVKTKTVREYLRRGRAKIRCFFNSSELCDFGTYSIC